MMFGAALAQPKTALEIATDLLKRFEGCKLNAYYDSASYATQGYGHLLSSVKYAALGQFPDITQGLADQWLADDVAKRLAWVEAELDGSGPYANNELAALTSLMFNIGRGAFRKSTVRRLLTTQDPPDRAGAAAAFLLWDKVDGVEVPGLKARREAEKKVFETP